jgi:hypothetical protein
MSPKTTYSDLEAELMVYLVYATLIKEDQIVLVIMSSFVQRMQRLNGARNRFVIHLWIGLVRKLPLISDKEKGQYHVEKLAYFQMKFSCANL